MSMTVEEALQWFKGFYNGNCEREDFENTICADCNFPCRHGLPILRAISALEEIQQYREYREIFESHFTEDALKLFSDKEEFSKWLERGKWIAKKCDELSRGVEAYRAIGLGSPEEAEQDLLLYKADRVVLKEYEAIGTVSEFRENKNFLEFLYNHIPLNEMEQYLAMYHASEGKESKA